MASAKGPLCPGGAAGRPALLLARAWGQPEGVAYERKAIDPQAPLQPGKLYELVISPRGGDLSRVTRADLERALRRQYGEVRVLDWGRRGGDWVVRLKVEATPASTSDPWAVPSSYEGLIQPAFLLALPAVLSAAAVVAVLYLVWRIVADLKEAVELVPAPARAAAVAGAGVGMGALGLAALGLVVLAFTRRRRYA